MLCYLSLMIKSIWNSHLEQSKPQKKVHWMEQGAIIRRSSRFSTHDKRLLAIGLAILAILSPLYIDHRSMPEPELDEEPIYFSSYLPLLHLVLITAIAISGFLERGFTSLDPYWIHRVGGSSTGIIIVLIILSLVLKCKASPRNWCHGLWFQPETLACRVQVK